MTYFHIWDIFKSQVLHQIWCSYNRFQTEYLTYISYQMLLLTALRLRHRSSLLPPAIKSLPLAFMEVLWVLHKVLIMSSDHSCPAAMPSIMECLGIYLDIWLPWRPDNTWSSSLHQQFTHVVTDSVWGQTTNMAALTLNRCWILIICVRH